VIGEALWGLQANLIVSGTVLALLLQHFGASATAIGAIVAIDMGCGLLPQVFGPFIFISNRHRKRQMVVWHFVAMIPFLGVIAGIAHFGHGAWVVPAILVSWACFVGAIGLVVPVWIDWLARLFDKDVRGTLMGLGWGASAGLGIVGALFASWLMHLLPEPQVFGVLYALAAVLAYVSIGIFLFIDDPAATSDAPEPPRPRPSDLLVSFRASLAEKNFRSLLVGRALASAGFAIAPFIALHYASTAGGGLSGASIVAAGAAGTLGTAIGCLTLGRLGDRRGHRPGVLIGLYAQIAALICLLLIPGMLGILLVFLGAGISGASVVIAHNNMLLESCPHDDRVAHIIVGNLVAGAVGLLVPLVSGTVVDQWGYMPLFTGSLVISLAGLFWVLLRVQDPRTASR
ncbi:MAG: MFS transporter, partial [Planctomycetota bacterium]